MLFNIVMGDMEGAFRRRGWRGVKLGGEKIYTLAYADDVVLLAEDEEGMKGMLPGLEEYLKGKRLELNAEKTKVMRFRKGGGRMKKVVWYWRGKKMEEVKEFRYLGYVLQRNGGQEAHIRERTVQAARVMRQVWGIGKRRFGNNWMRRLRLFDLLVCPVMGFGAEIWGWKERERMERVQERFVRCTMGVDWRTPGAR